MNAHYLSVFSGDFFVEFGLREVPERGADWCAHVLARIRVLFFARRVWRD
jgi:hypothetical protein